MADQRVHTALPSHCLYAYMLLLFTYADPHTLSLYFSYFIWQCNTIKHAHTQLILCTLCVRCFKTALLQRTHKPITYDFTHSEMHRYLYTLIRVHFTPHSRSHSGSRTVMHKKKKKKGKDHKLTAGSLKREVYLKYHTLRFLSPNLMLLI